MAVLVTGGAGFVGLNIVEALVEAGGSVVVLDRLGAAPALRPLAERAGERLAFVEGDVRDGRCLADLFRSYPIDGVIHAAVVTSGPGREAADPDTIIDVNLKGPISVLQASRDAGCRDFVYVGSGAAYGRAHLEAPVLYEDVSPSRPEDLYGTTKFAAERTVIRLGDLWQMNVACVRLGSVFGPWEFATGVRDTLSPQFQAAALAIRGEAAILPPREVRRDWIYSRDVATGLVAVLRHSPTPHRLYHLTSGGDWSGAFGRFCDGLKATYPAFSWRYADPGDSPNISFLYETDRAHMDSSRIARDASFRPGFTPDAAYADYVAWICRHEQVICPNPSGGERIQP